MLPEILPPHFFRGQEDDGISTDFDHRRSVDPGRLRRAATEPAARRDGSVPVAEPLRGDLSLYHRRVVAAIRIHSRGRTVGASERSGIVASGHSPTVTSSSIAAFDLAWMPS